MDCEVCGNGIRGKAVQVRIEGSLMRTCERCAKFGTQEHQWSEHRQERSIAPRVFRPQPRLAQPVVESDIVENYAELIRHAREKAGLTQEDFGKKINEKASIIARLESRAMVPSTKLARKLEKALGIKLLEKAEEAEVKDSGRGDSELTIGDMINIKKR